MFEHLANFSKILVTGPQRSGTTICARMIAHDLLYDYLDEEKIGIRNYNHTVEAIRENNYFVLQCPGMSRWVHEIAAEHGPLAVVWMRRDIADIIASQERIDWDGEDIEKRQYREKQGPISAIKYRFWDTCQRYIVPTYYEVDYDDLYVHPLWVPTEQREKWGPRQWKV